MSSPGNEMTTGPRIDVYLCGDIDPESRCEGCGAPGNLVATIHLGWTQGVLCRTCFDWFAERFSTLSGLLPREDQP